MTKTMAMTKTMINMVMVVDNGHDHEVKAVSHPCNIFKENWVKRVCESSEDAYALDKLG